MNNSIPPGTTAIFILKDKKYECEVISFSTVYENEKKQEYYTIVISGMSQTISKVPRENLHPIYNLFF